jgi:Flp pilus assembly protein TadD/glutathione synthase/RimK-type ligase-like ATP-grasp enzyme
MPPKPATLAIRVECAGNVTEDALARIEELLAANGEAVDLRFARACLLEELGRLALARGAYKGVLARDAYHFGALMNLGTMLYLEGRRPEARVLYTHATQRHPHEPSAFVNLGNVLVDDDPAGARAAYERALQIDPAHTTANFALALLLEAQGDAQGARDYYAAAFARPILRVAPYRGAGPPLRLLVLLAANGGNIVTTLLLDETQVEAISLVADSWREDVVLPPHDLIFNAIGDADRSADALAQAERIVAASGAGVVNSPAAVRRTARTGVARLAGLPGVKVPLTLEFPRERIDTATLATHGFTFPLLLRAPGYHMGEHFEYVATADALPRALAKLPGDEILAIEYLDARGADGKTRKYRALIVDGALYPVHLAISAQWKIHYFSADMRHNEANRAEEARYLADLPAALGARATAGLAQIGAALELEYAGVDFGLDRDGNVLVFEANPTMAIYYPDGDERFAYRHAAIERIVAAVRRMFSARATRP